MATAILIKKVNIFLDTFKYIKTKYKNLSTFDDNDGRYGNITRFNKIKEIIGDNNLSRDILPTRVSNIDQWKGFIPAYRYKYGENVKGLALLNYLPDFLAPIVAPLVAVVAVGRTPEKRGQSGDGSQRNYREQGGDNNVRLERERVQARDVVQNQRQQLLDNLTTLQTQNNAAIEQLAADSPFRPNRETLQQDLQTLHTAVNTIEIPANITSEALQQRQARLQALAPLHTRLQAQHHLQVRLQELATRPDAAASLNAFRNGQQENARIPDLSTLQTTQNTLTADLHAAVQAIITPPEGAQPPNLQALETRQRDLSAHLEQAINAIDPQRLERERVQARDAVQNQRQQLLDNLTTLQTQNNAAIEQLAANSPFRPNRETLQQDLQTLHTAVNTIEIPANITSEALQQRQARLQALAPLHTRLQAQHHLQVRLQELATRPDAAASLNAFRNGQQENACIPNLSTLQTTQNTLTADLHAAVQAIITPPEGAQPPNLQALETRQRDLSAHLEQAINAIDPQRLERERVQARDAVQNQRQQLLDNLTTLQTQNNAAIEQLAADSPFRPNRETLQQDLQTLHTAVNTIEIPANITSEALQQRQARLQALAPLHTRLQAQHHLQVRLQELATRPDAAASLNAFRNGQQENACIPDLSTLQTTQNTLTADLHAAVQAIITPPEGAQPPNLQALETRQRDLSAHLEQAINAIDPQRLERERVQARDAVQNQRQQLLDNLTTLQTQNNAAIEQLAAEFAIQAKSRNITTRPTNSAHCCKHNRNSC